MKNSTTYTFLLALCILFTSCGNMTITKRHYTKGYYFNNSNKHSTVKSDKANEIETEKSAVVITEKAEVIVTEKTESTTASNELVLENNNVVENNVVSTNLKDDKIETESTVISTSNLNAQETTKATNIPKAIVNKTIKKGIKHVKDDDHHRSLFWTIILVLFIIWVIGFVLGGYVITGLINLVLLVALILFILWLLRVL